MHSDPTPRSILRPAFASPIGKPGPSRRGCAIGHHAPLASSKTEIDDMTHARCRFCGCQLMRMNGARRWFRTGMMG